MQRECSQIFDVNPVVCGSKMSKKLSGVALRHDFKFVWWQTVRIKIFGVARIGKTNSYSM